MWQVDESATGSVNLWSRTVRVGRARFRWSHADRPARIAAMHLRAPSVDRGVQSFVWALVFFLFLFFGMVAIAIGKGTALTIALVASFLIFVFVRVRG
jgi:hypothetical protein